MQALQHCQVACSSEHASVCSSAGYLEYALDVATKMLPLYERILEQPFPLPKLDFVGVPNFAAGAMENYGLITFADTDFVVDPASPSVSQQLTVMNTVVHEMAHLVGACTCCCVTAQSFT